jgi:hypothetical protein
LRPDKLTIERENQKSDPVKISEHSDLKNNVLCFSGIDPENIASIGF